MSGKETSCSFAKRRGRRQTTDNLRTAIQNENEDNKRFPYFMRKFTDELDFPHWLDVNTYLVGEDGQLIPVEKQFVMPQACMDENFKHRKIDAFCDMGLKLIKVICVYPRIDIRVFSALNRAILIFSNLFTLRLDYCDLTSDNIRVLAETLSCQKSIKELSLKGSPNNEQNFYLLMKCELKYLNLKFCGIDENGLKMIAEEYLKSSPNHTLLHLNLSSNMVFNEGCKYVAKILRCDRTLHSLNLADCKIGDEGLEELMKSLQKFYLCNEELYVRRKLRFEYFRLLQREKDGYFVDKRNVAADGEHKEYRQVIEEKLKKHPFTADSVQENGGVLCKGNYKLESLNVSFNHLTKPSFHLILKVLMTQSSEVSADNGLKRLVMDGNPDGNQSENVRNAIEEMLLGKKIRHSVAHSHHSSSLKNRQSIKRRKSSGASSIEFNKNKEQTATQ